MAPQITGGALRTIFDSPEPDPSFLPTLQVLQVKAIPSQEQAPERFRVVFSDSVNFVQSMLSTNLNSLIKNEKLVKHGYVKLLSYQTNLVKEKKILIVLNMEIIDGGGNNDKIGAPVAMDDSAKPAQEATATSFYGNQQRTAAPAPSRAPALAPRGNPGGRGSTNVYPIEALSPYQNKWTIKARVTQKSDIRNYTNAKGEGRLFSVVFIDESGEIKATGFSEAVDTFYEQLEEGKVYYVSGLKVNLAKKQFNTTNNDYELMFERDTEVTLADQGGSDVPKARFSFRHLKDLHEVEAGAIVDVIGILQEVHEVQDFQSKTGNAFKKRDLLLVDNTGWSVRTTVWGNQAENWSAPLDSVVAFKGAKVSEYSGRTLSALQSSTIVIDPDIDEAHKLKGWYDASGKTESFASYTNMGSASLGSGRSYERTVISQINSEDMTEEARYFEIKATVVYIKQDPYSYPACVSCNRKITELTTGQWQCDNCGKASAKANHRYLLTLDILDHTGHMWLNTFNDVAEGIMSVDANKLKEMEEDGDRNNFSAAFQKANAQSFVFKVRAKMETWQEQSRVKYSAVSASSVGWARECAELTKIIDSYTI